MSASGRASEFMQAWGEGHNKPHNPGHKAWGADDCDACTAEAFDPWEALVHAARIAGFLRDEQGRTVTAVPPPVPPEIVRRAAEALNRTHWNGEGCGTHGTSGCSHCYGPSPADADEVAETVLDEVYGDIVEAARRDALTAAARVIGDEAAADGVYGTDVQGGLLRAGWIVGNMARHGLSASVSDQGADPRTPTTPGAQIAAEPVFPSWVMQAMDDHQQRAETRMRRLLDEEPTDD